jgi:hypothetical protein
MVQRPADLSKAIVQFSSGAGSLPIFIGMRAKSNSLPRY